MPEGFLFSDIMENFSQIFRAYKEISSAILRTHYKSLSMQSKFLCCLFLFSLFHFTSRIYLEILAVFHTPLSNCIIMTSAKTSKWTQFWELHEQLLKFFMQGSALIKFYLRWYSCWWLYDQALWRVDVFTIILQQLLSLKMTPTQMSLIKC